MIEVWSQSIIILITLVRMLRLFRVFRVINGFTVTLFSLAHSVPAILRYMAVIFAVLYAFAAIGGLCRLSWFCSRPCCQSC